MDLTPTHNDLYQLLMIKRMLHWSLQITFTAFYFICFNFSWSHWWSGNLKGQQQTSAKTDGRQTEPPPPHQKYNIKHFCLYIATTINSMETHINKSQYRPYSKHLGFIMHKCMRIKMELKSKIDWCLPNYNVLLMSKSKGTWVISNHWCPIMSGKLPLFASIFTHSKAK